MFQKLSLLHWQG